MTLRGANARQLRSMMPRAKQCSALETALCSRKQMAHVPLQGAARELSGHHEHRALIPPQNQRQWRGATILLPTSPCNSPADLAFNKRRPRLQQENAPPFLLAPSFRSLAAIRCSPGRRSRVRTHAEQRFFQARFCAPASLPTSEVLRSHMYCKPVHASKSVAPGRFQLFRRDPISPVVFTKVTSRLTSSLERSRVGNS